MGYENPDQFSNSRYLYHCSFGFFPNNFFCFYLRYFNKHYYLSEIFSFWLKKKLKLD